MTGNSGIAGPTNASITRRSMLKSGAGLLGAALASTAIAASLSRPAFAAAAKPTSLNMLYATSEADSDAIKAALPDFKSGNGHRHRSRHHAVQRSSAEGVRRTASRQFVLRHHDRRYALDASADQQDRADHRHGASTARYQPTSTSRISSPKCSSTQPFTSATPAICISKRPKSIDPAAIKARRLRHLRTADAGQRADPRLSQGSIRRSPANQSGLTKTKTNKHLGPPKTLGRLHVNRRSSSPTLASDTGARP